MKFPSIIIVPLFVTVTLLEQSVWAEQMLAGVPAVKVTPESTCRVTPLSRLKFPVRAQTELPDVHRPPSSPQEAESFSSIVAV